MASPVRPTSAVAVGQGTEEGGRRCGPVHGGEPLRNPFNPWIFHLRAGYADEAEHMVQQDHPGHEPHRGHVPDDGFGKAGLEGVEKALAKGASN
jgi:hypothetical protein